MPVKCHAKPGADNQRRKRQIKRQPDAEDVLPVAGAQHRFDHDEIAEDGVNHLNKQETERDAERAAQLAADDNGRDKQAGFKNVELKADVHPRLRHQQRPDRVADGAQQADDAQQLQDWRNELPFFPKYQRNEVI